VRRMMTESAARAKTHAVAGPVDRGVRPREAMRHRGGARGGCDWRWRSSCMRADRSACARASGGCERRILLRCGPSAGFFFGPSALQTAPGMRVPPTHAGALEPPATVAGKGRQ
jgi:hypothetical protein